MKIAAQSALCCALVCRRPVPLRTARRARDVPPDRLGRRRRRLEVRRRRRRVVLRRAARARASPRTAGRSRSTRRNPTAINELPFLERAAPKAQAAGVRDHPRRSTRRRAREHDPIAFCAWAAQVVADGQASGGSTTSSSGTSRTRGSTGRRRRTRAARTSPRPQYEALLAHLLRRDPRGRPGTRT